LLDDDSLPPSYRTISRLRQTHDNETIVERNHSSIRIQRNQNHGFTRYWKIKKVSDADIIQNLLETTLIYMYIFIILTYLYSLNSKSEYICTVCMLNVEKKKSKDKSRKWKMSKWKMSKMRNVERKKCRINRKSCLMLIMKYLFDFNGKKEKHVYYKWQIAKKGQIHSSHTATPTPPLIFWSNSTN